MEQIFSELEQFGLKYTKYSKLTINSKYIILGLERNLCDSSNLSRIKLSELIEEYFNVNKKPVKESKKKQLQKNHPKNQNQQK